MLILLSSTIYPYIGTTYLLIKIFSLKLSIGYTTHMLVRMHYDFRPFCFFVLALINISP